MSTTQLTSVEPGHGTQHPPESAAALGLREQVVLVRTDEGILVRPCPPTTWDDLFATRLTIGSAPPDASDDDVEVSGDYLESVRKAVGQAASLSAFSHIPRE